LLGIINGVLDLLDLLEDDFFVGLEGVLFGSEGFTDAVDLI
jgi:hypothetical protein